VRKYTSFPASAKVKSPKLGLFGLISEFFTPGEALECGCRCQPLTLAPNPYFPKIKKARKRRNGKIFVNLSCQKQMFVQKILQKSHKKLKIM